jgi:hypothetical protein
VGVTRLVSLVPVRPAHDVQAAASRRDCELSGADRDSDLVTHFESTDAYEPRAAGDES